jgi:signal peptidase I
VSDQDAAGALQQEWPQHAAGEPPKRHRRGFFTELPFLILIALGLAVLIKTFLVQAFFIPSESMEPTLHGCQGCRGDRVLVNRLVYRFREPRRGEVVVFSQPRTAPDRRSLPRKVFDFLTEGFGVSQPSERDFIKRIMALPNETIEMKDSVITITRPDGTRFTLKEPYARPDERAYGPTTVPAGRYFMMGDNRPSSGDSRFGLGTIPRGRIVGKAFVKIWPPGRMGRIPGVRYPEEPAVALLLAMGAWHRRRRGAGILEREARISERIEAA